MEISVTLFGYLEHSGSHIPVLCFASILLRQSTAVDMIGVGVIRNALCLSYDLIFWVDR